MRPSAVGLPPDCCCNWVVWRDVIETLRHILVHDALHQAFECNSAPCPYRAVTEHEKPVALVHAPYCDPIPGRRQHHCRMGTCLLRVWQASYLPVQGSKLLKSATAPANDDGVFGPLKSPCFMLALQKSTKRAERRMSVWSRWRLAAGAALEHRPARACIHQIC